MTAEQKGENLKPWLDYINNNDIDIKEGVKNEFNVDDMVEYKKLYDAYLSSGHFDFFMKHFNTPSQGVGIGCEGGTQLFANFTGNVCDFKEFLEKRC